MSINIGYSLLFMVYFAACSGCDRYKNSDGEKTSNHSNSIPSPVAIERKGVLSLTTTDVVGHGVPPPDGTNPHIKSPTAERVEIINKASGVSLEVETRKSGPVTVDLVPGSYVVKTKTPRYGTSYSVPFDLKANQKVSVNIEITVPVP